MLADWPRDKLPYADSIKLILTLILSIPTIFNVDSIFLKLKGLKQIDGNGSGEHGDPGLARESG